ncbi:hypothetical protein VPH35_091374 [Triticum aestivum]
MNSIIQVLNYESKMSSEVKPYVKKYSFTSYFTSFDPVACIREFDRINSEESLWKQDLQDLFYLFLILILVFLVEQLYFPTIKSSHGVILSINSLFERSHFFIPCGTILGTTQEELVYNLLSNYSMLCKLSKKPFKNVFSFKLQPVGPYPTNCLMHDLGHYLPLYIENFEGKAMKSFSVANISKYRRISAFKLFKSTFNKLKEEDLPIPN